MIANYVEGLWGFRVTTVGSYGETYKSLSGAGKTVDTPREMGESPENFGDSSVSIEEICHRLSSPRS